MDDRVYIFDTTLRDGEQSPGASLNPDQKLVIAWQLARLGVDVIEAGFPLSSPGDFEAVQRIARQVEGPMITALARAARPDIDAVWQAVQDAARKQIHMVLSVSDIHIERKLRSNRGDVLRRGVEAVAYARSLCDDVEYSPEDAVLVNTGGVGEGVAADDRLVRLHRDSGLPGHQRADLGQPCGVDTGP